MQVQSHADGGRSAVPRFDAALRVLPGPTGKITIPEWARKVQPLRAWSDLNIKTIEMRLRAMRADHQGEIGSEWRPSTHPGEWSGWLVWRRSSRKTP